MRQLKKGAIATAIWLALTIAMAAPAWAGMQGPCTGSVTIDGIEYDASNDTADNPIVLPENREGLVIPYEGGITVENTNYLGAVGVVIGPATVNVADWGFDENDDDIRSTAPNSRYTLGGDLNDIVGLYQLTAFHDADGGNCDATAMLKLEGDPLQTPVGAGAAAGAVISGIVTLTAGIPKKRP